MHALLTLGNRGCGPVRSRRVTNLLRTSPLANKAYRSEGVQVSEDKKRFTIQRPTEDPLYIFQKHGLDAAVVAEHADGSVEVEVAEPPASNWSLVQDLCPRTPPVWAPSFFDPSTSALQRLRDVAGLVLTFSCIMAVIILAPKASTFLDNCNNWYPQLYNISTKISDLLNSGLPLAPWQKGHFIVSHVTTSHDYFVNLIRRAAGLPY